MNSQSIAIYILKTIFISGILLGYYWLILRNRKLHQYNRFYLLCSLVLSIGLPLVKYNWITVEKPLNFGADNVLNFVVNSHEKTATAGFNRSDWALLFFAIVSFGFLLALIIHINKIYRIKRNSRVIKTGAIDLIYTEEDDAPFSFLNNLFWKQSISLELEDGKKIFNHELTHIHQKHSLDRLFSQLLCSIIWINPFFWIIQKELLTIHEFIADEQAIGNSDTESFARMLLQTHYGNHFLQLPQSLFYSPIKRRLFMLTTSKKIRFSYVRRFLALPLFLVIITVFSLQVNATTDNTKLSALSSLNKENHDNISADVREPAKFPGGKEGWQQFLSTTCKSDKIVEKGSPPGVYAVKLSFIVDKDGDVRDVRALNDPGYGSKEDAMRVLLSSPKWIPATLNGKPVIYRNIIKITYAVTEE